MEKELLEKKLNLLPDECLGEVATFIDYLLYKNCVTYNNKTSEDNALLQARRASMKTVWEIVKNDTW